MGGNRVNQETSMHIKSILISEERFVSGELVNHVATGSPQDDRSDVWTYGQSIRAATIYAWDTARRAVATASSRSS
jgi:hypothetical protein